MTVILFFFGIAVFILVGLRQNAMLREIGQSEAGKTGTSTAPSTPAAPSRPAAPSKPSGPLAESARQPVATAPAPAPAISAKTSRAKASDKADKPRGRKG